jgi:DtxR family Mn-dependent transcriptional regulator
MNVKMPTVSSMLKTLNDRGLVNYEKYEYVEMTRRGANVGKEMHRRHGILLEFLTEIPKIDHEVADEEACKMEHALSPETLDSLTDFMAFIQACPRTGKSWLDYFKEFRQDGCLPEKCREKSEFFKCEFRNKVGQDLKRD